jgi:ankyrin repeat protein
MGYKDIVKLLLNYKNINIDLRNNKGMFPKDMAITNDIAKLFDMYEEKKGMKKKDKNNGEDINGENNG